MAAQVRMQTRTLQNTRVGRRWMSMGERTRLRTYS